MGVGHAVGEDDPNLGALVPELVEPDEVQHVSGLFDLTTRIAAVAGPGSVGALLRCTHAEPLRAFGATVNADGPLITVRGPGHLTAADVAGEDIRAVTALVIAALAAEGTSTIRGMYHLRRGYGSLLPKLSALGARLTIDEEMP
ncbi:hypothetical protein [Streptomyces triculaminicus]|uniref:hypothetical protein n=1 Tax=Streptomyces triculaminicus TaxID=2816232 RepID=UPI0037A47956